MQRWFERSLHCKPLPLQMPPTPNVCLSLVHTILDDEGRLLGLDKAAGICTFVQGMQHSKPNLEGVLSTAAALSCNAPGASAMQVTLCKLHTLS